jgi:glycine/D-amino acid oxidase-like deaminating enzyme
VSNPSDIRIAVTGAVITGTTTYKLARRGCKVTLFDKHRYTAMETNSIATMRVPHSADAREIVIGPVIPSLSITV